MRYIKASFNTADKSYNLLFAKYDLIANFPANNKQNPSFHGGNISIAFELTENIDLRSLLKEDIIGQIVFYSKANESIIKQIDFQDAILTHYEEKFNSDDKMQGVISITLYAKKLTIRNSLFDIEF